VTNATGETISVTPIGAWGPEGRRAPLPMFARRVPAVPSRKSGDFAVEPGQSIQLLYDWDDINLSEIVVRFSDGEVRQLVVDHEPTKDQYREPAANEFTIDDRSRLEAIPDDVRAAAARAS